MLYVGLVLWIPMFSLTVRIFLGCQRFWLQCHATGRRLMVLVRELINKGFEIKLGLQFFSLYGSLLIISEGKIRSVKSFKRPMERPLRTDQTPSLWLGHRSKLKIFVSKWQACFCFELTVILKILSDSNMFHFFNITISIWSRFCMDWI